MVASLRRCMLIKQCFEQWQHQRLERINCSWLFIIQHNLYFAVAVPSCPANSLKNVLQRATTKSISLLPEHVTRILYVASELHCVDLCLRHHLCQAYDYRHSSAPTNRATCELLLEVTSLGNTKVEAERKFKSVDMELRQVGYLQYWWWWWQSDKGDDDDDNNDYDGDERKNWW